MCSCGDESVLLKPEERQLAQRCEQEELEIAAVRAELNTLRQMRHCDFPNDSSLGTQLIDDLNVKRMKLKQVCADLSTVDMEVALAFDKVRFDRVIGFTEDLLNEIRVLDKKSSLLHPDKAKTAEVKQGSGRRARRKSWFEVEDKPEEKPFSEQKTEDKPNAAPIKKKKRKGSLAAVIAPTLGTKIEDEREVQQDRLEAEEKAREHLNTIAPVNIEKDDLATADVCLTFKDCFFSVRLPADKGKSKEEMTILEKTSGHIRDGRLTALMGPSGSGKTTLMDIVANMKTSPWTGEVYMNGNNFGSLFRRIASYMPQTDIMPQHWRVREAVTFNAMLKKPKPSSMPWKNFLQFAYDMLASVGLDHAKATYIGGPAVRGISGGEKRRVSLVRCLVAKPALVFSDEPTTGLSATDAEIIMKTMWLSSKRMNVTYVVVIHQPRAEICELFTDLIMLTSRPGRTVYNGAMQDLPSYLLRAGWPTPPGCNPVDHYLDLITPELKGHQQEHFVDLCKKQQLPVVMDVVERMIATKGKSVMELLEDERSRMTQFGKLPAIGGRIYGTSYMVQLKVVLHRKVVLFIRDPEAFFVGILGKIIIGVLFGSFFYDVANEEPVGPAQVSFAFNLVMNLAMGAMDMLPLIVKERDLMKFEASLALYAESVFVGVCMIVDHIVDAIKGLGLIGIAGLLGGYDVDFLLRMYLLAIFLSWTMTAILLAIAAWAPDIQVSQSASLAPVLLFCYFSGFIVSRRNGASYLQWLLHVSPVHYTMEAIAWDMYGGTEAFTVINEIYGYDKPNWGRLIAIQTSFLVAGRITQLWFLRKFNNIRR